MAKRKTIVGNVSTSKDGSFYIKVNEDITLKKGSYLNLENEKSQLAAIDYAVSQGWIDEKEATRRKEQTEEFWNASFTTKDGKTFTRKEATKYQVTMSNKD